MTDEVTCPMCGAWTSDEALMDEHLSHHDERTGEWHDDESEA